MRETKGSSRPDGSGAMRRRGFLKAAAAGAAFVIGGSVIAVVRTGGYRVPAGVALTILAPWQFEVVQHAARRITASDRPGDGSIPSSDDVGVAAFADGWLARLPPRTRRDVGRLLAYLEHLAPLAAGRASRFTCLEPIDQDRVLASLQASSSELLRAGFDGLRSLVFLGYYRDPRTWTAIGYDGPWVGRPPAGRP